MGYSLFISFIFSNLSSAEFKDNRNKRCAGKDGEPCDKQATYGPEGGKKTHCSKCKPGLQKKYIHNFNEAY